MNESDLIKQILDGDIDAFSEIIDAYGDMVRSYLYSMTPDMLIADDIAQEVFCKLYKSLNKIDHDQGIKAYLMTMTKNQMKDYWRKKHYKNEIAFEEFFNVLEYDYYNTKLPTIYDERREFALKECIQSLSERVRKVVELFYYEDFSCETIASHLDISNTNVRSILYRTRKKLYSCIINKMEVLS